MKTYERTELWRDLSHLFGDGIANDLEPLLDSLEPELRAAALSVIQLSVGRWAAARALCALFGRSPRRRLKKLLRVKHGMDLEQNIVDPDPSRFNMAGTRTGRWSSSAPNLQNVPRRRP